MATVINQYAAGIYRKEIDQSNTLASVGTSIGALVTRAPMGPANREVIIADYPTFVNTFGGPVFSANSSTPEVPVFGYGPYAAEEFLNESNELHVVRITDTDDKYPMVRFGAGFTITTKADNASYTNTSALGREGISSNMDASTPDTVSKIGVIDTASISAGDKLIVGALGPGTADQNIGVTLETFNTKCDWILNYDDYPTDPALSAVMSTLTSGGYDTVSQLDTAINAVTSATSAQTSQTLFPVAYNIVKISIYTKSDAQSWSDINNKLITSATSIADMTPVETWYGTIPFMKDVKNNQLRLKDVVNGNSQYIYVATYNATLPIEIKPSLPTGIFNLGGGAISHHTGVAPADSHINAAWDFFVDREYATVNILICTDSDTSVKQKVATIAANRMDCCAVGQSGNVSALSVAQVLAQEKYGYKNPSYIGLYAGWDLKYDQANDRNLYVPKALYGASLFARVDRTGNTWDAPAGNPNGILSSKEQNHIFSFTDIGLLQKAGINTSRFLRSTGHTMWGQRTAQIKDSALNRINVRRLLIYIENTVELTMFPFLFNIINDARSRLRISTIIDNFLGSVVAGGGATAAQAVCNEKNNTPDIIDASQMVIDLFVTPSKPVEVIQINTRITKTGVSFTETVL